MDTDCQKALDQINEKIIFWDITCMALSGMFLDKVHKRR